MYNTFASDLVSLGTYGLPGEGLGKEKFFGKIIKKLIQLMTLGWVIGVTIGGYKYIISYGKDENKKSAKICIIWSTIGTAVSMSAYGIINLLNNFNF